MSLIAVDITALRLVSSVGLRLLLLRKYPCRRCCRGRSDATTVFQKRVDENALNLVLADCFPSTNRHDEQIPSDPLYRSAPARGYRTIIAGAFLVRYTVDDRRKLSNNQTTSVCKSFSGPRSETAAPLHPRSQDYRQIMDGNDIQV